MTKTSTAHGVLRRARTLAAIVIAVAVVQAPSVSHAADNTVAISVPATKGKSGAQVKIPITMNESADMGALHVELTFDPAVLQPQTAERGKLAANALVDSNPQNGRFTIGLVSPDKINGNGEVVVATFKVVGKKSAKSSVGVENAQAWVGDVNRFDIKVSTTPGSFAVTGGSSFPWWIVAVVAALLIGGFIYARTRKKEPAPAMATATGPPTVRAGPATEDWFYVDTPQPLLTNDRREITTLQPGTWYRGGPIEGDWMQATDNDGNKGWVDASKVRRN